MVLLGYGSYGTTAAILSLLGILLSDYIPQSQQITQNNNEIFEKLASNYNVIANPTDHDNNGNTRSNIISGTTWAVLVAGSKDYVNYRHQADVCHAYQILKKGGLKDENIIVFMYDDIAFHVANPRPGIIINKPNGNDVYEGVPKDYTGKNCTAKNFFAALLGNKTALSGGSGKVVESGPNDHIFIFYCDHGSPGSVSMPYGDDLYAKDLIDVLKKKHEAKAYKSMVFYMEACESGSMFEGLLGSNWSIYAVTAASADESSWATYCPGQWPSSSSSSPFQYDTCLGDVFSVSWMEDSDVHDMSKETLEKQYKVVKRRTATDSSGGGSHVTQYGDMELSNGFLSIYIGTNPTNDNFTASPFTASSSSSYSTRAVNQRDADLLYLKHKIQKAPKGSKERMEAEKELKGLVRERREVDRIVDQIATILFGDVKGKDMLKFVRPSGLPLVDDWDCLKLLVKTYEKHCGPLTLYGKKYKRAIANMCNDGINVEKMTLAASHVCSNKQTYHFS